LLPYTWNGVVFNADGIQSTTFTTVAGCDSTVVMELFVVPNLTSTNTITLCPAAFSSYTWNGIPITAANTYTFNTTTISGCDSIATLIVNEALTLTSTTNITICEDLLPYSWNSIDRTTAGTFTYSTNNAYGCDSIATLNLTVIPTATSTENLLICPDQAPYNWNGTSYTTDGIYTTTLTSVLTGCDSLATLNLTIRPVLSSTTDSTICFEQNYSGVDGDSATLAELCLVLSTVAHIPLDQSIAVTGSVNQFGEVQPIGGVNEKIEGFFKLV
jgi:hypothetical protein